MPFNDSDSESIEQIGNHNDEIVLGPAGGNPDEAFYAAQLKAFDFEDDAEPPLAYLTGSSPTPRLVQEDWSVPEDAPAQLEPRKIDWSVPEGAATQFEPRKIVDGRFIDPANWVAGELLQL